MDMSQTAAEHFMVGGGIASLAAAVFLVRDAGVPGEHICILEQRPVLGGSLDGSGDAADGYLTRGGRMFEPNYVCTFDLLDSIPALDDPSISVKADMLAFNAEVPGFSECRLVRDGRKAEDRLRLRLGAGDIFDLVRLTLTPEARLDGRTIESWFRPGFFDTNFWLMWSTMFSFQPWHSLAEMRRYMRRFIHMFPGLARIAGVLRTRYNQYDSLIEPIRAWLSSRGVRFRTGAVVSDVEIDGDSRARRVTRLVLDSGETIAVAPADRVYITLGSMTDASCTGSATAVPALDDREGAAWRLWRRLAARHDGLGRPEVFCADTAKTAWNSFTVTLDGPEFFDFMERFSGNRTGTGGLVTFAGSGWTLSVVMFHQPHFRTQAQDTYVFWGYGLRGERNGDFVRKPMWHATGAEILQELAGQLRLTEAQAAWFSGARIVPCRMPFITSQFMPRRAGDRPPVRPAGAENFAIIGQFCEMERDCVFTVEYSVRSAWAAVHAMTGRVPAPPAVVRTDARPDVLWNAARVLLAG
ncbi:oleate hydratase [Blastochloris tepida]|uniref:Oleate hydratase n=2 Tax=Blastochloris tepida TaxID=2233851 RepID=A0A348FXD6_9HYPH|nr:oleate hydratase [Blastochloris tepida]